MTRKEIFELMPKGYEKACCETKAMSRRKGLQNEKDLLTLCLFYAYDHSLIEVQSYARSLWREMKIIYCWILTGIFSLDMLDFYEIFESVSLICHVEKRCKRRSLQMSEVCLD